MDEPKDKLAQILSLVPTYAVPSDGSTKVRRLGGRPRKIERAPDHDQEEYADRLNAIRETFEHDDPLVQALDRGESCAEIIETVKLQVAREAASISFDKQKAAARGGDIGQLAVRRIDALAKLAALELARMKLGLEPVIDVRSPRVQQAVGFLLDEVERVAREVLDDTSASKFVSDVRSRTSGWESVVGD
jgi:hypothetical protein